MKLSVKSDYAARAVLGLSRHYQENLPQRVETLAAEQGIPPKFLVQILIELKSRNIVRSLRGKQGGYMLARPPAEISMGDVLRCMHGHVFDTTGIHDKDCPPELRRAWLQLQTSVVETANAITFQQLMDAHGGKNAMYYI
ncbi:MAG: Rrf2 family transcriptional regulator [Verrucomicrobiota bacterium]